MTVRLFLKGLERLCSRGYSLSKEALEIGLLYGRFVDTLFFRRVTPISAANMGLLTARDTSMI